jgi:hypothetical protein
MHSGRHALKMFSLVFFSPRTCDVVNSSDCASQPFVEKDRSCSHPRPSLIIPDVRMDLQYFLLGPARGPGEVSAEDGAVK